MEVSAQAMRSNMLEMQTVFVIEIVQEVDFRKDKSLKENQICNIYL